MVALFEELRQWLQPREYRINAVAMPRGLVEALGRLAKERELQAADGPGMPDPKSLIELGTELWRLRRKMLEADGKRPKEQFRREYRHVEWAWDWLRDAGFEFQDHEGEKFDPGRALRKVGTEYAEGLDGEWVAETISPSVYYRGRHVQYGQVIVKAPAEPASAGATGGREAGATGSPGTA